MNRGAGRFDDRVALVTGAGSGIGREAALQLAGEGAAVCVTDIHEPRARQTAGMVAERAAAPAVCRLDVRCESEWQAVMERILALHGRLDVLINCAGVSAASAIDDMAYAEWREVFAVNVDGAFLATRHGVRVMRARGGSIVHVSSASGVKAAAGACAYSASKAAVCMLSKAAARECCDRDVAVRINTVCPGGVKTPMWRSMPLFRELVDRFGSEEAAFERLARDTPGGRFAEPADVVAAILFLASQESRFVTGIDLVVDGGYVL